MNRKSIQRQLDFVESLSPLERGILQFYATNGFIDVNNLCRGETTNFKLKDIKTIINIILDIISRSPPTEKDITVYRGIHSKFYKNHDYEENSFVSTSRTFNGAIFFADRVDENPKCCVIAIKIPKGSTILPLEDISNHESEFEIVLPIGSNFKYIKEKIIGDYRTIFVNADVPRITSLSEKEFLKILKSEETFVRNRYMDTVKDTILLGHKIHSNENPILLDIYEKFDAKGFMKKKILKDLSTYKIWHKIKVDTDLTIIELLKEVMDRFLVLSISHPMPGNGIILFFSDSDMMEDVFDFLTSRVNADDYNVKVSIHNKSISIGLGDLRQ